MSMTAKNDRNKENPALLSSLKRSLKYIATFISGGIIAAVLIGNIKPAIRSGDDIPSKYFVDKHVLDGTIVKIIDGDTYKFHNNPGWGLFGGPINQMKDSFTVRIAAVDTPEIAKKGQSGQKYGDTAKDFATKKLLGKRVKLKLLKKDQYNRVLGIVRYHDGLFSDMDISEELLRQGLATIYRQGGAEYDGRLNIYTQLEREAIGLKRRIWERGEAGAELPSAYKKRIKASQYSKI